MNFQIDHDMHIHTFISPCAGYDPRQTAEAILAYGVSNDLRLLCIADHVWDKKVPSRSQNLWLERGIDLDRARSLLPLPQSKYCRFLFGMEADMDFDGNIAVSREEMDKLDFIIFAPSHMHLGGFSVPRDLDPSAEAHKALYLERLHLLMEKDIPFHKAGLAHPACPIVCEADPVRVFDLITDREYEEIWTKIRDRRMGVEINIDKRYTGESLEHIMRQLRIAKAIGCKFYLGGDAHTPDDFRDLNSRFHKYIDILGLTEEDKHPLVRANLAPEAPHFSI